MVDSTIRYKFHDFELDPNKGLLKFRDERVAITPKALQILVVLLRKHGEVVDKEVFLREVWPATYVEESTLAQNILTLRKTLRRFDADRDFIITVPRQGYKFVEEVQIASLGESDRHSGIHSIIEIHTPTRSSPGDRHVTNALVSGDGS